jgi:hypothetical protein
MAPITIDTKDIVKAVGIVIVVVILLGIGAVAALFIFSPGIHIGETSTTTIAPTPTPVTSPYPQLTNIVTVSSMTTSGGQPQVGIQEDSRTFFLQNWADYDNLRLGDRVQFTIVGTQNLYNGVQYTVSSVNIVSYDGYDNSDVGFPIIYGPSVVSSSNDYPVYYYDPNTHSAWQWDGRKSDRISIKELRGERVRRGRPPN